MKGLIGLGIVGLVGVGLVYWVASWSTSDPGIAIAHAFGNPAEDTIELHVAVYMGPRTEPPRIDPDLSDLQLWQEWLDEHYQLRDDAGTTVEIERIGHSLLMPAHKVGGAPEFFLKAGLRQGTEYTFDFTPRRAEPNRYRYTFIAPAEGEGIKRKTFEPVEEG